MRLWDARDRGFRTNCDNTQTKQHENPNEFDRPLRTISKSSRLVVLKSLKRNLVRRFVCWSAIDFSWISGLIGYEWVWFGWARIWSKFERRRDGRGQDNDNVDDWWLRARTGGERAGNWLVILGENMTFGKSLNEVVFEYINQSRRK